MKIYFQSIPFILARYIATCIVMIGCSSHLCAEKIPVPVCGCVYMQSGDTILANGITRLGMPQKKKSLAIIEGAYTSHCTVGSRITPEAVDSIVVWVPTSPQRLHTLHFLPDYGWCWLLEKGPVISVYCYSPKGYYLAGNGGMWYRNKGWILVVKDGEIYKFDKPHKNVGKALKYRLATLVQDDPDLAAEILQATGRKDKILRRLSKYNPTSRK